MSTHVLHVRVVNGDPVWVEKGKQISGDPVWVDPSDTIKWMLQGSRADFRIDVEPANPFNESIPLISEGQGKIEATIASSAKRGDDDSYKYTVTLDNGKALDPRIIVR